MKNQIRYVSDYFIKAHPQDNVLWARVGEGHKDHQYWYPPESSPAERLSFTVDAANPGTDVAAETAASMTAASMVFAQDDPEYSATLLDHAKRLYTFADTYRGTYSDVIADAASFYNSFSGYQDELVWGALWLHKATGDQVETWLDGEMPGSGKTYTAGGLLFGTDFLPIPYAMGVVNGALAYLDLVGSSHPKYATYRDFVVRQTDYMLGANPEGTSYVVGFGSTYPLQPHHRAATGSTDQGDPDPNAHVIVGALVGGPAQDDQFSDSRPDVKQMEPAISSNAQLVAVAAAFVQGIPEPASGS